MKALSLQRMMLSKKVSPNQMYLFMLNKQMGNLSTGKFNVLLNHILYDDFSATPHLYVTHGYVATFADTNLLSQRL